MIISSTCASGAGLGVTGAAVEGAAAVVTATGALDAGLIYGNLVGAASGIGVSATGGTCSFTSKTLVMTENGKKAIGILHIGDRVLAYNPSTHKIEFQPIQHVWVHSDNDLVDVTLTIKKGGRTYQKEKPLSKNGN